jgi:uncharacterized membrane protein
VSALQNVARALELSPDSPEAQALKAEAEPILAAQRQAASIRAQIRNARSRFSIGKHLSAVQLLERLDPAANPEVADALAELRRALHDLEARPAADPPGSEEQTPSAHDDPPTKESASDATTVIVPPRSSAHDETRIVVLEPKPTRLDLIIARFGGRPSMIVGAVLLVLVIIALLVAFRGLGVHGL